MALTNLFVAVGKWYEFFCSQVKEIIVEYLETEMWKRLFRRPLPLPHLSLPLPLWQNLDSNKAWTLSHLWICWQAWLSKPEAYDLQGHITS